jgi:glycosyltransferase involved in cell wall biosynthesis
MVVDGETGFLVPPESVPPLADALLRVLRDPELRRRFGRAGRQRVETYHSPRRMCRDAAEMYASILGLAPATVNTQSHLFPRTVAARQPVAALR